MNSIFEPDTVHPVGRANPDARLPQRSHVAVSFGSPASDSGVGRIDLNDVLIAHPQASFLMRAKGRQLESLGLQDGDLLLLDRAITPQDGHLVVAVIDDTLVCRHLRRRQDRLERQAHDADAPSPVEGDDSIWGVVTWVLRATGRLDR